jgi:hypothetical protein
VVSIGLGGMSPRRYLSVVPAEKSNARLPEPITDPDRPANLNRELTAYGTTSAYLSRSLPGSSRSGANMLTMPGAETPLTSTDVFFGRYNVRDAAILSGPR